MENWMTAVRHVTHEATMHGVFPRHDLTCKTISPPLKPPKTGRPMTSHPNVTEIDLIRPIDRQRFSEADFLADGHLYQFGIGRQGVTLRQLVQTYMPPARVAWGFDTFEGIPESDATDAITSDFSKGNFAAFGGLKA